MHWSLSEFLNLIEFRSQTWCFFDLAAGSGISVPHSEAVSVHAVLDGRVGLSSAGSGDISLAPGDVVFIISGDAHTLRTDRRRPLALVPVLEEDEYVDSPATTQIGDGVLEARLLSGRLKARWPSGSRPRRLPTVLSLRPADIGFDLRRFAEAASGPGSAALLTRTASMLFIAAFRDEPRCRAALGLNLDNPIARAQVLIEKHPFQPWTVESLASKVGMGRSNFAERFAAEVGTTPIDALTAVRMGLARDLLCSSQLKVVEVCERVGYRSEASFIRRFTDHFGMTPAKFRRATRAAMPPDG